MSDLWPQVIQTSSPELIGSDVRGSDDDVCLYSADDDNGADYVSMLLLRMTVLVAIM